MNLVVGHSYFKDGFDRFVKLYPTATTETLLRNGKMLFKRLPNGITILYRTLDDEETPLAELEKTQVFTFYVKAENQASLLNITNLDESAEKIYAAGKIVCFTNNPASASANQNNPEILTNQIIDSLKGPLFSYQFAINGNPGNVVMIVTDEQGNPVSVGKDSNGVPFPLKINLTANSNNLFIQQVDLRSQKTGRYRISILNQDETITLKTEEIYVDGQLEKDNILGIVEIKYDSVTNHLYGEIEEYKLQFRFNETYWKYFFVNKSSNIDFATDSLVINDSGNVNGGPYQINNFQKVYSSIKIAAKTAGQAGNNISMEYSGAVAFPAVLFSGKTLSGGAVGANAEGIITIINNEIDGYSIKIGAVTFTEGADFEKGTTSDDTALNLVDAINGDVTVAVSASLLKHDILVNNLQTLVFGSLQKIPFYEVPKLKIELRKKSDNQMIIANLPNPSHNGIKKLFADRFESEVYVFI
jgi:hypothetical protein